LSPVQSSNSVIFVDDAHTFGGAQIALGNAVRAILDYSDAAVTLVTTEKTRNAIQNILGDSARIRHVACPAALPLNIFSFPLCIPAFWRLLRPLVRESPNAAWFFNLSGIEFCMAALCVLRLLGKRPVAWLHNPERFAVFNRKASFASRYVSRFRDVVADIFGFQHYAVILTPSWETTAYTRSRMGPRKSTSLAALYPTLRFTGDSRETLASGAEDDMDSSDYLDLWMIGRIDYGHKNNELALASLRHLLDGGTQARLTVVGDGPDKDRLLDEAQRLQLTKFVKYVGWKQDPWVGMRPRAIVVIPSNWEANCLVAIECLFRGIRLVLTSIPAFREMYPELMIAAKNTPEAFSETILHVAALSNEQLSTIYAEVVEQYAPSKFVADFFRLVNSGGKDSGAGKC
jgi:glycosyltransferase involved in cell wall biosynthesis